MLKTIIVIVEKTGVCVCIFSENGWDSYCYIEIFEKQTEHIKAHHMTDICIVYKYSLAIYVGLYL